MSEQERQTSLRLHRSDFSAEETYSVPRDAVLQSIRGFDWASEWSRAASASAAGGPWCAPAFELSDCDGYALFVQVMEDCSVTLRYEHPTRVTRFGFCGNDDTGSLDAVGLTMEEAGRAVEMFYHFKEAELIDLLSRYGGMDGDIAAGE